MRRILGYLLFSAILLMPALSLAQTPSHSDPYIPGPANEGKVIQEVRHQLVMLPYYTIFDDLGFRVEGSHVTLEGAVTNPTLKSDAEGVVKRVEGVTGVTNNIEVLPLSPMDWQIRRAVARTIYGDPAIGDRYGYQSLPPIHVIVKNGNVILEGYVSSTFDKNLINTRVNGVPNIFHVTNNLQVTGGK
jgi:hyperosmotically inducible periplasmic protein